MPEETTPRRAALLGQLAAAGRDLSDATVLFHTAVAEKLGLGVSDWKMLSLLERHGPLTAGALSEHSGLAPPTVTGIVDRLERNGWVHRTRDPEDRRRVVVELDPVPAASAMGELFGGLMRRLSELYERYDDDTLELLLEFMVELSRRQNEATAELSESGGRPETRGPA